MIVISRDIQKLERRLKALSQKVYIVCIIKRFLFVGDYFVLTSEVAHHVMIFLSVERDAHENS